MGLQFSRSIADAALILSDFWPRLRDRYPKIEVQPPLPPIEERFGPQPTMSFQLMGSALPSRYWFLSADDSRLVQVQADRLIFNWRRQGTDAYPRYRTLRAEMVEVLNDFGETLKAAGQEPAVTWCEVTYINPVPAGDPGSRHIDLAEILKRVVPVHAATTGFSAEDSTLQERFLLEREGNPYGRLYVNAAPAFSLPESRPIYVLDLTVRGMPSTPQLTDSQLFLDHGRELIVRHFRDITTDQMHERWGLQ